MIHTYTAYKNDEIANIEPEDYGGEQVVFSAEGPDHQDF
jgi:hypothetical protein